MQEPQWAERSVNMPVVWRAIVNNPGIAVCGLMQVTGLPRAAVDKSIRALLKREYIHISGYQRFARTEAGMARQFTAGPGVNKKRPKVPQHKQLKRQRDRCRARSQRVRAAELVRRAGAFGLMVVQLSGRSVV